MTFIPYYNRIEIEPIARETVVYVEKQFKEMGKVLSVGSEVRFVKPGDTLFFVSHGVWETNEIDGVKHYVIAEDSDFILGKIDGPET